MKNDFRTFSNQNILISPSLLAADFAHLADQVKEVESAGVEALHLDIMDGHFVPNLTFGPPVVATLRKHSNLLFDTHLMLTNPSHYVAPFARAGADHITFHIECDEDPHTVIKCIRDNHCTVGISLKPKTSAESILPYLPFVDLVLIMSVEPGFGGQSFMYEVMDKTQFIRKQINQLSNPIHLEIDGGIDEKTVSTATTHGANALVAGTAIFRHSEGINNAVQKLRNTQLIIE